MSQSTNLRPGPVCSPFGAAIPLPTPKGIWRLLEDLNPHNAHLPMVYTSLGLKDQKATELVNLVALRLISSLPILHLGFHGLVIFNTPFEWTSAASQMGELIIYTRSCAYDTGNNEYYLGWFELPAGQTFSGSVELLPDAELDYTHSFRCTPSSDGHYIDVYSSMEAKQCIRWTTSQRSARRLRLVDFNDELDLLFVSEECKICHGMHRKRCPYERYLPNQKPAGPIAMFSSTDSVLFRGNLVQKIISRVERDKFILIEAPPCSGKTTLLNSIWESLRSRSLVYPFHLVRVSSWAQVYNDIGPVVYNAVVHNDIDCCLPTVTDGRGLMDYILNPNRKPLWLCADEVQQTYGDEKLWDALFDIARRTPGTFIIAAGNFGSHTGSTSHSPPSMILPKYRMTLFHLTNDKDDQLSIAFTEEDFQQYMNLLAAPQLCQYWDFIKQLASPSCTLDWTPGWHPGVVSKLAKFLINRLAQSRHVQLTKDIILHDFTSECLANLAMNITVDLGRGVPRPPNHCFNFPPPVLNVFHDILEKGMIRVPGIDASVEPEVILNDTRVWDRVRKSPSLQFQSIPFQHRLLGAVPPKDLSESRYIVLKWVMNAETIAITPRCRILDVVPGNNDSKFKPYSLRQFHRPCHALTDFEQAAHDARRMGWLLQVPAVEGANRIELVYPTRWHEHYMRYLLKREGAPREEIKSLDDLLFQSIANFSAEYLRSNRDKEKMVRERIYEQELARSIKALAGPTFASCQCRTQNGDGYIDFKIDEKQWLIELLKEGTDVEGHIKRFNPGEKYDRSWNNREWDWRVVDFRMLTNSTINHSCPNYRLVKFEDRGSFLEATMKWTEANGTPKMLACVLHEE